MRTVLLGLDIPAKSRLLEGSALSKQVKVDKNDGKGKQSV